jgi:hypothetical protein
MDPTAKWVMQLQQTLRQRRNKESLTGKSNAFPQSGQPWFQEFPASSPQTDGVEGVDESR